jgi:hypothetical protein
VTLKRRENEWAFALGLHIEVEFDSLLARDLEDIVEAGDTHINEPLSHPGSSIEESELIGGGLFECARAAGQSIELAVVVQNKLSIEGPPDVEFNEVATHAGSESERLKRVFRQISVGSTVAEHLHLATL